MVSIDKSNSNIQLKEFLNITPILMFNKAIYQNNYQIYLLDVSKA